MSSLCLLPLLCVHRDFREGRGLSHAGLTDSNQLEERQKGHDRFQPRSRVPEDGAEVELRVPRQHLSEFFELLAERDVLHLYRDLPRRWQAVEHPPEGTGERSEEHTSELQSHVNLVCRLLL